MTQPDFINDPCEGLLQLQDKSIDMRDQFNHWMGLKGVTPTLSLDDTEVNGIILQNIMNNLTSNKPSDPCFTRDGHDRGCEHDRDTFDKWCI